MNRSKLTLNLLNGTTLRYTDYQLVKRFPSKRNEVYLLQVQDMNGKVSRIVVKLAGDESASLCQEAGLQQLLFEQGLSVPGIIRADPDLILMPYLSGDTLVDYFDRLEEEQELSQRTLQEMVRPIALQLADWLQDFGRITAAVLGVPLIMGDVNLRNFLVCDGRLYGLDLEDARPGEIEEDAGRILAFIVTYDPPHTAWKQAIAQETALAFRSIPGLNFERLKAAKEAELQAIAARRYLGKKATPNG